MKLLILTQKVDQFDTTLGFFHRWIEEFSKHFEFITVICLYEGNHHLPPNVKVLSLGKETGRSRSKYVQRLLKYAWQERKAYDGVFVHMNQEYVLLAGWLWKLLGKSVSMWRNHHAGSTLTDMAAVWCDKIFCTSKYSYTARYKRTVLMPVGIPTDLFSPDNNVTPVPRTVLSHGRISPTKNIHLIIDALQILKEKNVAYTASIFGDPLPKDMEYFEDLKHKVSEYGIGERVKFYKGVPIEKIVDEFRRTHVFINAAPSGMYDKTIFEAMASGALVLVSNKNLKGIIDDRMIFEEGNVDDLARKLEVILSLSEGECQELSTKLRELVVTQQSLSLLGEKLASQLTHITRR